MDNLRTDFENLNDGDHIMLYPLENNPLHNKPVEATHSGGYFYCVGSNYMDGDVLYFNRGFTVVNNEC